MLKDKLLNKMLHTHLKSTPAAGERNMRDAQKDKLSLKMILTLQKLLLDAGELQRVVHLLKVIVKHVVIKKLLNKMFHIHLKSNLVAGVLRITRDAQEDKLTLKMLHMPLKLLLDAGEHQKAHLLKDKVAPMDYLQLRTTTTQMRSPQAAGVTNDPF